MKKTLAFTVAAVMALGSIPAMAAPGSDKNADNAADTSSGTLCIVRGSEGDPYIADPDCSWHVVEKQNKDGSLAFYRYQDKGTLQPGNVVPTEGVQIELSQVRFGMTCFGTEVVSPSGQYSSDLVCKAS